MAQKMLKVVTREIVNERVNPCGQGIKFVDDIFGKKKSISTVSIAKALKKAIKAETAPLDWVGSLEVFLGDGKHYDKAQQVFNDECEKTDGDTAYHKELDYIIKALSPKKVAA